MRTRSGSHGQWLMILPEGEGARKGLGTGRGEEDETWGRWGEGTTRGEERTRGRYGDEKRDTAAGISHKTGVTNFPEFYRNVLMSKMIIFFIFH